LPQSFAAPLILARLTSAPGQNGPALYGMRWRANRILNRWISSLNAKAESTTVRRGLRVTLAVEMDGKHMQDDSCKVIA
jgi:hypothetical protein